MRNEGMGTVPTFCGVCGAYWRCEHWSEIPALTEVELASDGPEALLPVRQIDGLLARAERIPQSQGGLLPDADAGAGGGDGAAGPDTLAGQEAPADPSG